MWGGGARETHLTTCHNEVTPSKRSFLNLPAFLDLNGITFELIIKSWNPADKSLFLNVRRAIFKTLNNIWSIPLWLFLVKAVTIRF